MDRTSTVRGCVRSESSSPKVSRLGRSLQLDQSIAHVVSRYLTIECKRGHAAADVYNKREVLLETVRRGALICSSED
eukprot:5745244-Amphidinium_carterae.1